jgi:hypothetical protein
MSILFYAAPGGFSDDFDGVNGSNPDSSKWSIVGDTNDVFIQDNQLRTIVAGTSEENGVASLFKISGDFSLHVDFNMVTGYGSGSDHSFFITIQHVGEPQYNAMRIYLNSFSEFTFIIQRWVNGGFAAYAGPGQQADGDFKLSRSGSLWQPALDLGAGYIDIAGPQGIGSDDVEITLTNSVWGSVADCKVDFDNFTIESGTTSLI